MVSRVYRSGDLARRRADGMLELVGRRDHQLKIRGFRIEPAEIEHVLDGHPAVARSLVLARKASEADADVAALVAYLIPAGRDIDRAELRRYLKTRLPVHLIPTAFLMLEAFPLTTNGKVDRAALPNPPAIEERVEGDSGAPFTPVQEVLAEIWIELLQARQVGIHQDFFELGGDSIKATRLAARVRERTGVSVPVGKIFEAPTIAEQAEFVEACSISKSE
jgi:aryl carrier-like protein